MTAEPGPELEQSPPERALAVAVSARTPQSDLEALEEDRSSESGSCGATLDKYTLFVRRAAGRRPAGECPNQARTVIVARQDADDYLARRRPNTALAASALAVADGGGASSIAASPATPANSPVGSFAEPSPLTALPCPPGLRIPAHAILFGPLAAAAAPDPEEEENDDEGGEGVDCDAEGLVGREPLATS